MLPNAFCTGRKPVYRLTTRRGNTIRATGNHKFLAFDGWRRLDDLAPGIRIALSGVLSGPDERTPSDSEPAPTLAEFGLGRERAALLVAADESDRLAALTTGDVDWDEIGSIERDGEEEVYDLTVDGVHNFVAEDTVVHNSIEQDADLVMFLYRDEYYNDQSEDQGLAEVILAKHRNGPIGTEKLAFLKRFAKFSDLAPQHDARVAAA